MRTSSEERIRDYTEKGWWTEHTLHGQLAHWASQTPEAIAVADQPDRAELCGAAPYRLSFAELDRASDHLAAQLLAGGVGRDDVVLAQLPNITELLVLYYAVSKLGAIISPVPVQYGEHELQHILNKLEPAAFVTIDHFKDQPLAQAAESMLSGHGKTRLMGFGDPLPDSAFALTLSTDQDEQSTQALESHRGSFSDDPFSTVTICWTSGTTGTPKGVPRSHAMWFSTGRNTSEAGGYQPGERLLNPFPLVNMAALGGFLFPSMLFGLSIFLHHPLNPPLFLQQIQQEGINFTIAPPPLLNQLAKSRDMWEQFDFSALRAVGSGSAPLSPSMIDVFDNQYGKQIVNFYGSNEGISLFSTPAVASEPEVRASMFPRLGSGVGDWQGNASRTLQTKVVDTANGAEIREPGQAGELLIAGATVFDGYLDTDNSDVFTEDGFFRTGDLVEICGEPPHYYRIAGRCKDIINRGGMKISPSDIDVLLEGFPQSVEAAVCAYEDERLGEKICACLVVAEGDEKPRLEEINEFLLARGLAKFKLPERLEFFDALPRNPLGKVQRFVLQDAVAERT